MGKNKKNKNLNQFIMDDEFVQTTNQTDTNTEPFETIPNKKKNPFQQLQNIENNYKISKVKTMMNIVMVFIVLNLQKL